MTTNFGHEVDLVEEEDEPLASLDHLLFDRFRATAQWVARVQHLKIKQNSE